MTIHFRAILIIIMASLIVSCGQSTTQQQSPQSTSDTDKLQKEVVKTATEPMLISTFSTLPPEIDGCGCRLSASEQDFKKKTYLFVDDGLENAFIRINNKMTKFHFEDSKSISNKHSVSTYSNGAFNLIIDIEQTGQGEEVWDQKGTLQLTTKDGQTVTKNIVGQCGC